MTTQEPQDDPKRPEFDHEKMHSAAPPKDIRSQAGRVFARLARRARGDEKPAPFPGRWGSPISRVHGGGLWPGLHVLVGTPKSGKSQFALQFAVSAARAGHPVMYVGLEMGELDIIPRLAALLCETKQSWSDLLQGQPDEADIVKLAGELERELGGLPAPLWGLYPDRAQVLKAGGIAQWLAEQRDHLVSASKANLGTGATPSPVVIFDFLQLAGMAGSDTRTEVADAAYSLRELARDVHCPTVVLAISSTARATDHRDGAKLRDAGELMGSAKESGEIEYAADSVMFLAMASDSGSDRTVDLAVAGGRHIKQPCWLRSRFERGTKHQEFRATPTTHTPASSGLKR